MANRTRRLPLAVTVSTFLVPSSLSPFSLLLFATPYLPFACFCFATPMRGWRSAGGAQVHARHPSRRAIRAQARACDRHAGVVLSTPGVSREQETPRLSALHRGDFAARACARRCPAVPPGSSADLLRRSGHRDPKDQVSRASLGGLQIRKPDLGTATGLAPPYRIASRKRPS
jgi:hypothetical protein